MTKPTQIEFALNDYGLSLLGLPRRGDYSMERINAALSAVDTWTRSPAAGNVADYAEFICHQQDVIELLLMALAKDKEAAKNA